MFTHATPTPSRTDGREGEDAGMDEQRMSTDDGEPGHRATTPSRRQVIAGMAGGIAAAALAAGAGDAPEALAAARGGAAALPKPEHSQVDKIVVLMMENRSFDHMLGWLPGAERKQAGLHFPDKQGKLHPTWHLPFTQSCGYFDPNHGYHGGRTQMAGGKLDGWLLTPQADLLPIGYYQQDDLPFYGHAAPYWTVCDHYFAATMAPTYPNRFYQHSAQTDRRNDNMTTSTMPTIWDRLADAGVSHRYYFSDVPFTALWGNTYTSISEPIDSFMTAAKAGTLPSVSFVDPRFLDEGNGTSGDDHPLADIRVGQGFVSSVYDALVARPRLGPDPAHRQLRRVGRVLRPCPTEAGPRRASGIRPARLPGPGVGHGAQGAPASRRPPHLRPHQRAQADRVALRCEAIDPA
jgi:phospholipase C